MAECISSPTVALAHLVDNLPAGAGMDAYRPVYASTVCWINGRAGMALFFSVPVGAVVLENAVFFAVTAFNICAPQGDANVGNIYKLSESSAKFLCRV